MCREIPLHCVCNLVDATAEASGPPVLYSLCNHVHGWLGSKPHDDSPKIYIWRLWECCVSMPHCVVRIDRFLLDFGQETVSLQGGAGVPGAREATRCVSAFVAAPELRNR